MLEDSVASQITLLIDRARHGDISAENELCEKVFHELYRIAKRVVPDGSGSVHPTMLVRELWIKLFSKSGLSKTENRRYFFTVAADQMRKIMIDHYRKKKSLKAGGDRKREPFEIVIEQAIDEFESGNDLDFDALPSLSNPPKIFKGPDIIIIRIDVYYYNGYYL